MNKKNIKYHIIFLIFSLIVFKIVLANTTISYNEKFLSYLSRYNQYFLWDLENKKLIKTSNLPEKIKSVFYIDNDNLALLSDNSILIANNVILNPQQEYNINYNPLFLYTLNPTENYYKFLLLTDKTINICEIKNDKLKYLKKDTILKPTDLKYISNNEFLVSANRFVYLYSLSSFLWFNFISKKKMLDFDKFVISIDIDTKKNKFLVLTADGILNLYTINFQNLKTIQLTKDEKLALYALNNSDIIVSDKTSSIRVYAISGSLKNTLNLPGDVISIEKTTDKLIIIYGDPEKPKLKIIDKEYNTIADI